MGGARRLHARSRGRGSQCRRVTLVADGGLAVHFEHLERRVPASTVERIVHTNSAGDGFVAGFIDASLDGADLARAWRATN
ncbi:MAG TPA: PfkB family carbohydrate kinase [Intrasporangium sp.]|uniref:PfkB family carbohydrate kinase n=1 Tax=Intrasporangium sp. TaxID=1925024 RepID=UPI002B4770DE|nr:PfkB family carbohydrate kinase [Intrasporangium sp.]HKX66669.1 PfkB family carbohydrate kinase [Intrasporangium sp.]